MRRRRAIGSVEIDAPTFSTHQTDQLPRDDRADRPTRRPDAHPLNKLDEPVSLIDLRRDATTRLPPGRRPVLMADRAGDFRWGRGQCGLVGPGDGGTSLRFRHMCLPIEERPDTHRGALPVEAWQLHPGRRLSQEAISSPQGGFSLPVRYQAVHPQIPRRAKIILTEGAQSFGDDARRNSGGLYVPEVECGEVGIGHASD